MTDVAVIIDKVTDNSLAEDDWALILDCCDVVNQDLTSATPLAIKQIIQRLQTNDVNTQLRTLTLLHSLAQNCGSFFYDQLGNNELLQCFATLVSSENIAVVVKVKLTEVVNQLVEKPEANVSTDTVSALRKSISSTGTAKASEDDDDDLKRAIELSLRDHRKSMQVFTQNETSKPYLFQVKALYDFTATEGGELSFKTGDIIDVIDKVYKEWWKGSIGPEEGIFPANYVEKIESSQTSVVVQETKMSDEDYILSQAQVIEQLLAILAQASQSPNGASVIDQEHVQQLYHQVAVMRPMLVQTIGKYCIRVQELFTLNQKLTQARRTYESMMKEATSSARAYQSYPYSQISSGQFDQRTQSLSGSSEPYQPLHIQQSPQIQQLSHVPQSAQHTSRHSIGSVHQAHQNSQMQLQSPYVQTPNLFQAEINTSVPSVHSQLSHNVTGTQNNSIPSIPTAVAPATPITTMNQLQQMQITSPERVQPAQSIQPAQYQEYYATSKLPYPDDNK